MQPRSCRVAVLLLFAALAAGTPARAAKQDGPRAQLNKLADAYQGVLRRMQTRPAVGPRASAIQLAAVKRYEAKLAGIDPAQLDAQGRITYRILKTELAARRESLAQWMTTDLFGQLGEERFSLTAVSDGLSYIDRSTVAGWKTTLGLLKRAPFVVNGYIALQEKALAQGFAGPAPAVETMIESVGTLVTRDRGTNPFLGLEREFVKTFGGEQKVRASAELSALRAELRTVVTTQVLPSHRKLHEYLKERVLPRASELKVETRRPGYRDAYLRHLKQHLGAQHPTPEALGARGREEVAMLRRELWQTLQKVGPLVPRELQKGARSFEARMEALRADPANSFQTKEELLTAAAEAITGSRRFARGVAPLPAGELPVEKMPAAYEPFLSAAVVQRPGPGGKTGQVLIINTSDLSAWSRMDLKAFLAHEGFPGHAQAGFIAAKQKGLPKFRQKAAKTDYDEGWALYSEFLLNERKQYTPQEKVGYLVSQLWRAARLVVDTGLHTGTMTPEQATRYFMKNAFASREVAEAEIKRYITYPGQALAYYHGMLQILDLRSEVQKLLGSGYDERAFHTKFLSLGSVPLEEARRAVLAWANRRKAQLARGNR